MRFLRAVCVLTLFLSWGFVCVDNAGKRHEYGPYKTKKECLEKRTSQVLTDRWVAVTECEGSQ